MRRLLICLSIVILIAVPVSAMEFTAPQIPESAEVSMPNEIESFGEGLWQIIQNTLYKVKPGIADASGICLSLISVCLLTGLLGDIAGSSKSSINFICTAAVGVILLKPVDSLIRLGSETIQQVTQYGRLLLPVMTAALAAQGAVTKSGALYTATALFDAILSSAICDLLIPLVYILLCVSIVCCLTTQSLLNELRKFLKWLPVWALKTILYVFTGYIGITGVVAGATDASMLKATKLTISGMVPVVGNILSDASEAVLVSAGLMKNAVGIYGMLAVIALWIGPFVELGVQYLMLRITAGICGMFAPKQTTELISDFSAAMGLVLAMTGAVCLIFLISTICYLKGVG